ncbi:hypothetical protein AOA59_01225 [Pseudomonas sp. 2822-15]|nr:hypothetical protein AOA59_01225 [Pseudomonas sp. 2822-15]CRM77633.1 hypothetical protein [Pseudomonas sp. 58 R 3]
METGEFLSPAEPLLTGLLLDSLGWNYVFIFPAIGSFTSFVLLLTVAEPIPHPAHARHCHQAPRKAFTVSSTVDSERISIGKTLWLGLFLTRRIKFSANKNADHC